MPTSSSIAQGTRVNGWHLLAGQGDADPWPLGSRLLPHPHSIAVK